MRKNLKSYRLGRAKYLRKGILISLYVLILASGCASTKTDMETWMGSTEAKMLSSWGAPQSAIETGDGSRILTWESPWGKNEMCRQSFTIDRAGIVTDYSYRGCLNYYVPLPW